MRHRCGTVIEKRNQRIAINKAVLDLDVRLIQALFAPAVKAGFFESPDFSWMQPDFEDAEDAFIRDLPALSEYYQRVNPVLSAAVWAIWDTLRTLRDPWSGWISMWCAWIGENRRRSRNRFILCRTIIATAAIRFSDGNASSIMAPRSMDNFVKYKEQVEAAIRNLSSIATS